MTRQVVPMTLGIPPIVHSSLAVRAGPFLFVSGLLGISPRTKRLVQKFPEVDEDGRAFATGLMSVDAWLEGLGSQGWQTFRNLQAVLEAGGSSLEQLVRLNFFSRHMHHHHLVNPIRNKIFQPRPSPPNTGCQVPANPANALFQASAVSFLPAGDGAGWVRRIVNSRAATPVSHYDLGVQVGPLVITGDLVPASQELQRVILRYDDVPSFPGALRPAGLARDAREETIRSQSWFLYESIRLVLEENGASLEDVIKLTVYLVDLADLAAFADVHAAVFGNLSPVVALTTVEQLGRPEFRVAIEVNAVVPGLLAPEVPAPRFLSAERPERLLPATSAGVVVGSFVFLGGLAGLDLQAGRSLQSYDALPAGAPRPTGSFGVDQIMGPVVAETWAALERGSRLLARAGASLDDVAALHVNLLDIRDLPAVDRVLRQAFPTDAPAVTVIQVPALPVAGSRVELEITAHTG